MTSRTVPRAGLRRLWPLPLCACLVLAGCYPGGPESASDLGMVVSTKVPGADYGSLRTFAMVDTVFVLDVDDTTAEPIDLRYEPVILEELRAQMVAAGFTDISALADTLPDVQLVCGAVQAEVWFYYYDWGYWGGWYPPYWGYYPPAVGLDSFETGTVLWQLMDLRGADPQAPETIGVLWLAGINGALQNSESATESGIRQGIRQGFAQSPYIRAAAAGN